MALARHEQHSQRSMSTYSHIKSLDVYGSGLAAVVTSATTDKCAPACGGHNYDGTSYH